MVNTTIGLDQAGSGLTVRCNERLDLDAALSFADIVRCENILASPVRGTELPSNPELPRSIRPVGRLPLAFRSRFAQGPSRDGSRSPPPALRRFGMRRHAKPRNAPKLVAVVAKAAHAVVEKLTAISNGRA
jgi:hypothetical protein